MDAPHGVQILSFLYSVWQKVCKTIALWKILDPPLVCSYHIAQVDLSFVVSCCKSVFLSNYFVLYHFVYFKIL